MFAITIKQASSFPSGLFSENASILTYSRHTGFGFIKHVPVIGLEVSISALGLPVHKETCLSSNDLLMIRRESRGSPERPTICLSLLITLAATLCRRTVHIEGRVFGTCSQ